jgi:hypothetical protein
MAFGILAHTQTPRATDRLLASNFHPYPTKSPLPNHTPHAAQQQPHTTQMRHTILSILLLGVAATLARAVFNPVECPITMTSATLAPGCKPVPGGQTCTPVTQVFCQYMPEGQSVTSDFCCSLEPSDPIKAAQRACLRGCEAAFKSGAECKRGNVGYKSCSLVAKAKLNDCKGFCYY